MNTRQDKTTSDKRAYLLFASPGGRSFVGLIAGWRRAKSSSCSKPAAKRVVVVVDRDGIRNTVD